MAWKCAQYFERFRRCVRASGVQIAALLVDLAEGDTRTLTQALEAAGRVVQAVGSGFPLRTSHEELAWDLWLARKLYMLLTPPVATRTQKKDHDAMDAMARNVKKLLASLPNFPDWGDQRQRILLTASANRRRNRAAGTEDLGFMQRMTRLSEDLSYLSELLVLQLCFGLTAIVSGRGLGLVLSSPERPGHDEADRKIPRRPKHWHKH